MEHRRQHPPDKLLSKSPREVLACDVQDFNRYDTSKRPTGPSHVWNDMRARGRRRRGRRRRRHPRSVCDTVGCGGATFACQAGGLDVHVQADRASTLAWKGLGLPCFIHGTPKRESEHWVAPWPLSGVLWVQSIPSLPFPARQTLPFHPALAPSFYPRWLMGYDRLGRPIVATQYGSLRLWEMTKLTTVERMTELHAMEQELLLRLLRRRTLGGGGDEENGGGEGGGHIVDTAVVVIDTAGLTLRHVRGCSALPLKAAPSRRLSLFWRYVRRRLSSLAWSLAASFPRLLKALRCCLGRRICTPQVCGNRTLCNLIAPPLLTGRVALVHDFAHFAFLARWPGLWCYCFSHLLFF